VILNDFLFASIRSRVTPESENGPPAFKRVITHDYHGKPTVVIPDFATLPSVEELS
jgi:hypothetical protein